MGGTILGVLFLSLSLVAARYESWEYEGPSMEPTIFSGDRVLSESVELEDLSRGDIVVVASQTDGATMIKRVVGLPGDVVAIADGTLVLNGAPATTEDVGPCQGGFGARSVGCRVSRWEIDGQRWLTAAAYSFPDTEPTTVAGGIYVLGDHLDTSNDSRNPDLGVIPFDAILGKVAYRYFSSEEERVCWDRLF